MPGKNHERGEYADSTKKGLPDQKPSCCEQTEPAASLPVQVSYEHLQKEKHNI